MNANTRGMRTRSTAHHPTATEGRCFVCDRPHLTTAHWCGSCGVFVCVKHDDYIKLAPNGAHKITDHLPPKTIGPLVRVRIGESR